MREGKYTGWAPMLLLGSDLARKKLGVLGLGRIGGRVVEHAVRGFEMSVVYYDPKRNEQFEKDFNATYAATPEEVLQTADFVSIHVPLLPSTRHLLNADRLRMMKRTSYLINTSRGPIIDEKALADALREGIIKGAAIDVFENEPKHAPGLDNLVNVVLTPHIASATIEARSAMGELAAKNIIAVLSGSPPLTPVQLK